VAVKCPKNQTYYSSDGEMNRRDFLKLGETVLASSLVAATIPKYLRTHLENYGKKIYDHQVYAGTSGKGWNIKDHFDEWMNNKDFQFPSNRIFVGYERIMPLRRRSYDWGIERISSLEVNSSDIEFRIPELKENNTYLVSLTLWPKETVDLEIHVAENLDELSKKPDIYKFDGVRGPDFECIFDIEHMGGEKVYYQVFYREGGKGKSKPFAPVRAFRHPKNNNNPEGYILADTHPFDDVFYPDALPLRDGVSPVQSGLYAEYFYDFFEKSLKDPQWFRNIDRTYERNIKYLKNTYNLANTFAYFIRSGQLPDYILKKGDDIGIGQYRYERQGLPMKDYEGNARKLWIRDKLMWSLLTPITPVYQEIGNHDGEESWNPSKSYATYWRKLVSRQPGLEEGGSPDQDYFVVPLADGKVELIVLNVVGYAAIGPRTPYDWILGLKQCRWVKTKLEESQARYKILSWHHVFGGSPDNSDFSKDGCYGRIQHLLTSDDYRKYGLDPKKIDQVKLTNLAKNYGVSMFMGAHDHVHHLKENITEDSKGRPMHSLSVGTTNEVREEVLWHEGKNWKNEYGNWRMCDFLNGPVIEKLKIYTGSGFGELKTIVTSVIDRNSNLKYLPFSIDIDSVVDTRLLLL
jgi:hypothetical protein